MPGTLLLLLLLPLGGALDPTACLAGGTVAEAQVLDDASSP
jgi:hypothetical protein